MKIKNQDKYYRVHVVTLIFMFANIYQIFSSNQIPKTYVNNQSVCSVKSLFN